MNYLKDLNEAIENNKLYGGNACLKLGITYNNKNYLIKFPKETDGFRTKVDIPFTTDYLNEYIGSNIYSILGFKSQNTFLGFMKNKILNMNQVVVACEDFTDKNTILYDFEHIKNKYSENLQKANISVSKNQTPSEKESVHIFPIEEIINQFKNNDILQSNNEFQDRFWDMFVIDCLIANNDRNNNNWGLLYNENNKTYTFAPMFDNAACFVSKHSDNKLERIYNDPSLFENASLNVICYFTAHGEYGDYRKLINNLHKYNLDEQYNKAIKRMVPIIHNKLNEIKKFIIDIPESDSGIDILSKTKKKYFIKSMEIRLNKLLDKELLLIENTRNPLDLNKLKKEADEYNKNRVASLGKSKDDLEL